MTAASRPPDDTPPHICKPSHTCCCSIQALEPHDECPIHGYPSYPRRCDCGKFVKVKGEPVTDPPVAPDDTRPPPEWLGPPPSCEFECLFNFLGWWQWSLGLHVDLWHPHLDIHVPFGFFRVGWRRWTGVIRPVAHPMQFYPWRMSR